MPGFLPSLKQYDFNIKPHACIYLIGQVMHEKNKAVLSSASCCTKAPLVSSPALGSGKVFSLSGGATGGFVATSSGLVRSASVPCVASASVLCTAVSGGVGFAAAIVVTGTGSICCGVMLGAVRAAGGAKRKGWSGFFSGGGGMLLAAGGDSSTGPLLSFSGLCGGSFTSL